MKAILLGESGFYVERSISGAPPVYRVPWVHPDAFRDDAESSVFMPSYGTIDFERVAIDVHTGVVVYRQANRP